MGGAVDKREDRPPPHETTPKAQDHNPIIAPRIAARSDQLSLLRIAVL
jgi:hypothetical protein